MAKMTNYGQEWLRIKETLNCKEEGRGLGDRRRVVCYLNMGILVISFPSIALRGWGVLELCILLHWYAK